MKQWLLSLAALIFLFGSSFSYEVVPQNLIFDTSSPFYGSHLIFLGDPNACPSCLSIESYSSPFMIPVLDPQNHVIQVYLSYLDTSASPPRQPVANSTIIAYLPVNKDLRLLYTDDTGMATFNLTPYDKDPNPVCQKIIFIYCPFSNGCGFQQCLEMLNITMNTVTTYPDNELAIPLARGTTFVASPRRLPETYQLLPAVGTMPYCPSPPITKDTGNTAFCLPFLLILGLLVGALQLSGRNPFGAFDMSAPRVTHHVRYEPRMRGVTMNWSAFALSMARSPMEFAGGGEGEEEGEGGSGSGAPKAEPKAGAKTAAKPGAKTGAAQPGGKVSQVQMAGTPAAKTKTPMAKKAWEAGEKGGWTSVGKVVAGFVPFVGLGVQLGRSSGLGKAMGLQSKTDAQRANEGKKSGASFGTSLGMMLGLAIRTSNIYFFLSPALLAAGASGGGATTRDTRGNTVGAGSADNDEAMTKIFKALGTVPLIGLFFKYITTRDEGNANITRAMKEGKVAELNSRFNIHAQGREPDLGQATKISVNMGGKENVQGLFLEGGDARTKTGFAFVNGQIVQLDHGKVLSENPQIPGGKSYTPNYLQVNVGGTLLYIDSRSRPEEGKPLSLTGFVMNSAGTKVELKDNKIVGMDVNGRWMDVATDFRGNQTMTMRPVRNDDPEFGDKLKLMEARTRAGAIDEAYTESIKTGKPALIPTYDGTTLTITAEKIGDKTVVKFQETNTKLIEGGSQNYNALPTAVREMLEAVPKPGQAAPSGALYENKEYTVQRNPDGTVKSVMVSEPPNKYAVGSPEFLHIMGGLDNTTKFNMVYDTKVNTVTAPGGIILNVERDSQGKVTGLAVSSLDPRHEVVGSESNPLTLSRALGNDPSAPPITINMLGAAYGASNGTAMDLVDKDHKGTTVVYRGDGRVGVENDNTTAQRMDVSVGATFVNEENKPTKLLTVKDTDLMERLETPGTKEREIQPNTFQIQPDGSIINAHTGETLDPNQRAALLASQPQMVTDVTVTLHDPAMIKKFGTDQIVFVQTDSGQVAKDAHTGKELTGAKDAAAFALAHDVLPKDCVPGGTGMLGTANKQRGDLAQAHQEASLANAQYNEQFIKTAVTTYYDDHPALQNFQDDLVKIAKDKETMAAGEEQRKIHDLAEKAATSDSEINAARNLSTGKTILEETALTMLHDPGATITLQKSDLSTYGLGGKQEVVEAARQEVRDTLLRGTEAGCSSAGYSLVTNYSNMYDNASYYHDQSVRSLYDPTFNGPTQVIDVDKIVGSARGDVAAMTNAGYNDSKSDAIPSLYNNVTHEIEWANKALTARDSSDLQNSDEQRRIFGYNAAVDYNTYMTRTGDKLPVPEEAMIKQGEAAQKAEKEKIESGPILTEADRKYGFKPEETIESKFQKRVELENITFPEEEGKESLFKKKPKGRKKPEPGEPPGEE